MLSVFEILFRNPGKIFKEKKLFKGDLICYISETEARKKLKFG